MVNEVRLSRILGVEDRPVQISCSVQESHLRLLWTGYPATAGMSAVRGALCLWRQHDSVFKEILLCGGMNSVPITSTYWSQFCIVNSTKGNHTYGPELWRWHCCLLLPPLPIILQAEPCQLSQPHAFDRDRNDWSWSPSFGCVLVYESSS